MTQLKTNIAVPVAQTKAQVTANLVDATPAENKVFTYNGTDLAIFFTPEGTALYEGARKLGLIQGRKYTQAQIDALFPAAVITSLTPSTGLAAAGGTVVTIKGDNFNGVSAITFGGTAGTAITPVSDTEIRVTTPAKVAGTYDVGVTNNAGVTTKTAAATFV